MNIIHLRLTFTLLAASLFISACANPAADKPKAVTSEAAPTSSAAVQGEKFAITPDTSRIEFVGSKVTGSHHGSFARFSGMIDFLGQPEKSKVSVTIDMDSESTDTEGVTKHLKTADFFDVAKYPQATFESTAIKPGGDKGATHTVTGNLQLHGVTKSITFPATIVVAPDAITVDSTFAINRKDFGINYAGAADNLIRDEVVLTLHVRGVKKSSQ
ncbi:MAG TPA: YceI family protein [Pyrinomonadaceae bacterium]|nr:YceI family protein [Pyrinomonadaceae bacterium]